MDKPDPYPNPVRIDNPGCVTIRLPGRAGRILTIRSGFPLPMILRLPKSLLICLVGPCAAATWSVSVIEDFEKPGAQAVAPLTRHSDGDFYGTSSAGGSAGLGTIFRVQAGGIEILRHLQSADGGKPAAAMISAPDGSLYGSTSSDGQSGFGSIFRYQPANGAYEKLHDFTGGADGAVPDGLLLHSDGHLYAVTRAGGSFGHGTVSRISLGGTVTPLHSFTGSDGSDPCGPLLFANGHFYGVCRSGGASGFGTLFRIDAAGNFTLVFSFTGTLGTRPGAGPQGGLMLHSSGKMFGTTELGGTHGFGTLFSLTTATQPVFATLHHFTDVTGSEPVGRLIEGNDASLYGCTSAGGAQGFGNVFRITAAGSHTALHEFTGADGATPAAGLIAAPDGILHGITSAGGPGDMGRVFTMSPAGVFVSGPSFSPAIGFIPSGAPVTDGSGKWFFPMARGGNEGRGSIVTWDESSGNLSSVAIPEIIGDTPDGGLTAMNGLFYGVCARGGASARGSAFTFTTSSGLSPLTSYNSTGGSLPEGPLVTSGGALFGIAREGGASARGSFYRLSSSGTRTRIVSFTGPSGATPGRTPRGPVAIAGNLSFFGVSSGDGITDRGGLFKINPAGTYSTIATFTTAGPHDPDGGLITAADGFIYGSCRHGGIHGNGAIIRISAASNLWETVASFPPGPAHSPVGEPALSPDASLIGLTATGHVYRWSATSGLEILVQVGALGRVSDESGLNHGGGIALLPDYSLLATLPGGGNGGGGSLVRISPAPLLAWKLRELQNADASDLDDPDGDSRGNLLEYALLSDPGTADSPLPVSIEAGRLQITLPRDPERSDVSLTVEASSDLTGPWEPLAFSDHGQPFTGAGLITGDDSLPGIKSVTIRDLAAGPPPLRRFIRLRVEP